jgi:beta-phosphoglucomutase-like phosphatase (HAD superfamily)
MSQIEVILFDCDGVVTDSELIRSQCAAASSKALV